MTTVRWCATPGCDRQAVYAAWCYTCCQETPGIDCD